ncbi:MAG: hypothetical protein DRP65_00040 [Planctomycetota bacterium]|nr:MAG: hypothetical protein DRP65_00040 [Planctomycetota bacterium]
MKDNIGGFRVGEYNVELDLTELVTNLLAALGKDTDKHLVHWLLLRFSEHQVELARILAGAFPELVKQMPKLFQKRVEDHRQSLRLGKLLSFRSASSIEEESVRRAWEETRMMVKELSLARDENLTGLVQDHRDILRRLLQTMVELVMREQDARLNLDFETLRKFLEA